MKLLITGGHGQVAHDVIQKASENGFTVHSYTRQDLDITNNEQVNTLIQQVQPDAVINCAAYTVVDKAEQEQENAFAVNQRGTELLAIACAQRNIPLIHLSTDYVFDGKATRPYQETDTTAPLNVYGKSKLLGEQTLQAIHPQHIILRVSGVFGIRGNNFVKTMLRLAQKQNSLRIVADQFTCPTPAADIATVIITMLQKLFKKPSESLWGTYHYCGAGITSWYDFANSIFEIAAENNLLQTIPLINAITTAEYPTAAKRPAYSVLDCQKLAKQFGITQKPWREGLLEILLH